MYSHQLSTKRIKSKFFVIVVLMVLLLAIGVAGVRHKYYENLKPVSASQQSELITVEMGATVSEIATSLKEKGLIKETWAFEWYVRNTKLRDKLQAGSYYLQPSQGIPAIADVLTKGKIATDLFTIAPGVRVDQIKASMVNAGFTPDDVENALNPSNYADHPALVDKPVEASLEGYLYPESFHKQADTKPTEIIRQSLDEMHKHLTPKVRAAITAKGLTVHQGITLASIVEREVSRESGARPTVAQIFLLRLQKGMQLQSDATASYGAILDGKAPSSTYDSAYNTYSIAALPPGPISNVSDTSLQAVASPTSTDYLYFVAGTDCQTRFSKTNDEHEALKSQHGVATPENQCN